MEGFWQSFLYPGPSVFRTKNVKKLMCKDANRMDVTHFLAPIEAVSLVIIVTNPDFRLLVRSYLK
jgi:hypothetical protein